VPSPAIPIPSQSQFSQALAITTNSTNFIHQPSPSCEILHREAQSLAAAAESNSTHHRTHSCRAHCSSYISPPRRKEEKQRKK
jgi:hypothetical protein